MYGEYTYLFVHFSGKICGRSCMREEGCSIHWKYVRKLADKQLTPCSECGKLTRSVSERCPAHIKGFYISQYYQRLRTRAQLVDK